MRDDDTPKSLIHGLIKRLKEIGETDDMSEEIPLEYMEAMGDTVRTLEMLAKLFPYSTIDELTDLFAYDDPDVQILAILALTALVDVNSYANQAARTSFSELNKNADTLIAVYAILGMFALHDPQAIEWTRDQIKRLDSTGPEEYLYVMTLGRLLTIAGTLRD